MEKIYIFVSPAKSSMAVIAKSEGEAKDKLQAVLEQHEYSVTVDKWKVTKIGAVLADGVYGLV